MRSILRLLVIAIAALAVVGGVTSPVQASAGSTSRAASSDAPASVAGCEAEYDAALATAYVLKDRRDRLRTANRKVVVKKRAVQRAQGKAAKKRARAALTRATASRARARQSVRTTRGTFTTRVTALQTCLAEVDPTDPTDPTDPGTNPLQPACDAGLPQDVCDAFAELPLPGGTGGTSPIQALCEAGLPQEICDAATGPVDGDGASPIQPLCDAGLPQDVCDLASGEIPSLPGLPGLPGLPDPEQPGLPGLPELPLPELCTLLPLLCPAP